MVPTLFALLVVFAMVRSWLQPERALPWMAYLWLCSGNAAFVLTAAGGANLAPAVVFLPLLIVSTIRLEGVSALKRSMTPPLAGFWLLMLVIWGAVSATFLPRLFEGTVYVFTTDRNLVDVGGVLSVPLKPVSGNLTQPVYLIGAMTLFACIVALLAKPDRQARFSKAVLTLATWNCGFAMWNLGELYLGLPGVLDVLRRMSGYAVMGSSAVGGLARITGLFPEASSFAGFTLPLFAYTFRLYLAGYQRKRTGGVAAVSFVLLLISTSSTAYAALAAYLTMYGIYKFAAGTVRGKGPRFGSVAVMIWLALVAGCVILLAKPEWVDAVVEFFRTTLIRKAESSSGIERGSWNGRAWDNFIDTWGVGIGLGSARASSLPMVLLSNLGVLGACLFAAFLMAAMTAVRRQRATACDQAPWASAPLHALVASTISAFVSATVFDLGLPYYAFAAAAVAGAVAKKTGPTAHASTLHRA